MPSANMANSYAQSNVMDFYRRYQDVQQQTQKSQKLMEDLILYCGGIESNMQAAHEELATKFENLDLDLTNALMAKKELQRQLQASNAVIQRLQQGNMTSNLKNRNPYVLALIDGDGLIFQDHWVQQGLEGGKKAAYALRSAILREEEVARLQADSDVEIITKVVCNLSGLARAMHRVGSVEDPSAMKNFSLGFTQAAAAFDFIDVGYGKERADSKIKELTRWHLKNPNCRYILMGISHDSGYAPFLDEVLRDDDTRSRVRLIEGCPLTRDLQAINVQTLNLGAALFRTDKLGEEPVLPALTRNSSPTMSNSPVITPPASGVMSYARITSTSTPPPPAASAPPAPQMSFPLATVGKGPAAKPKVALWNPGPRGRDEHVEASQAVMAALRDRQPARLCNNHYLRGPCVKPNCEYEHNHKISKEERAAIINLSRQNPCSSGQDCATEDCIYGHHCPFEQNGVCPHPYCKFPEAMHPPGTRFKNTFISKNEL